MPMPMLMLIIIAPSQRLFDVFALQLLVCRQIDVSVYIHYDNIYYYKYLYSKYTTQTLRTGMWIWTMRAADRRQQMYGVYLITVYHHHTHVNVHVVHSSISACARDEGAKFDLNEQSALNCRLLSSSSSWSGLEMYWAELNWRNENT